MRPSAEMLAELAAEATAATSGLEVRALVDTVGGGHVLLLAPVAGEQLTARLLVCTEADRARLHLARPRRPPKPRPPESAFTRDAHALVEGTRVIDVRTRPGDRTVTVRFAVDGGGERRLVAELFGNAPNLLLVDEEGIARAVKRRRQGARPLAVGHPYVPPPPPPPRTDAAATEPEPTPARAPVDAPLDAPDEFAEAHPRSAAVDAAFHPRDEAAARDAEGARVGAALKQARAKADGLVRNLERQLDAGAEADSWRRRGDLLTASFHLLRRGMTEIAVDDFEGGRETVPLDPTQDARGNVEACYKRARKLERAGAGAAERLAVARTRAASLAALDAAVRDARERGDALPETAALLGPSTRSSGRHPGKHPPAKSQSRAEDPGLRRFTLRTGYKVLVGKSNRDNDRLTLRVARGNDLWMHVHGDAGSHVVLRQEPGRTPSLEDLLDAASLALHFSKRRGATRAEVIYTPRKYVRKRKGMAAGAVTVDRHETLLLDDGPARARALLDTRDQGDGDGPDSLRGETPLR